MKGDPHMDCSITPRSGWEGTPWRFSFTRGYRPFHWLPRTYPGVNGCRTRLLVLGWWSLELPPIEKEPTR